MTTSNEVFLDWGERARHVAAMMGGVRKEMIEGGFDASLVDHIAPGIVFSTAPTEKEDVQSSASKCAVQLPDGRVVVIPAGSVLRIDKDFNLSLEIGGMRDDRAE